MIPILKLIGVIGKTFSKPIALVMKRATKNPQGKMRYYFIIGGQKVHYFENIIKRLFENKSIKNYKLTPPADDKCIDIFNEFLIEIVFLYGFIGGYAINEFFEKQKKSALEKEHQQKIYDIVEENQQTAEQCEQRLEKINAHIEANSQLIEELKKAQQYNYDLELRIQKIQNEILGQFKQQQQQQQQQNQVQEG